MRLREPIDSEIERRFFELIERRLAGEPVAYLVGEREFMGLPFRVGPGALVPRPETELLAERAIAWLRTQPNSVVLDVGTGSGAIALSVAKHVSNATVIGTDRSPEALAWAVENRNALGVSVGFMLGDLVEAIGGPIDLLLANLPYLRPEQVAENPDLHAEPKLALISGADGLDLIRRLLDDAPRVMSPGGAIALEIDPSQATVVEALGRERFPGAIITTYADLAGLARHVWIQLAEGGS
jgi:release factor glutamine methyltransferase